MPTPTLTLKLRRRMVRLALLFLSATGVLLAPLRGALADPVPVPAPAASSSTPPAPPVPPKPPGPPALVVNAEIMVLHATMRPGPGSIDPAIGKMPQLQKPPFSVFNTYRLLDKKVVPIDLGRAGSYSLPNGSILQVTFANPTQDKRFHIQVAINTPGGTAYLKLLEVTASPNETFFVAGQPFKDGVLVLGLTMRP
jgi:hypothetical protein